MNRLVTIAALAVALAFLASSALAGEGPAGKGTAGAGAAPAVGARNVFDTWPFGIAFGCGMIILGAAYGISKIGSSAVESMARQPEVSTSINTAMIISAALIEGITFFALIVCLLRLFFKE